MFRRGVTLPETIVVAVIACGLLTLVSLSVTAARDHLKRQQACELLRQLDMACDEYGRVSGTWPAPAWGAGVPPARPAKRPHNIQVDNPQHVSDDDAEPIIESLAAIQPARELLERVDSSLRVPATRPGRFGTFRDGWGMRLHCLTASSPSLLDRQAVTAHGGKPIFVSASQDRTFVGPDGSAAAGNLRTDEWPQSALRERRRPPASAAGTASTDPGHVPPGLTSGGR